MLMRHILLQTASSQAAKEQVSLEQDRRSRARKRPPGERGRTSDAWKPAARRRRASSAAPPPAAAARSTMAASSAASAASRAGSGHAGRCGSGPAAAQSSRRRQGLGRDGGTGLRALWRGACERAAESSGGAPRGRGALTRVLQHGPDRVAAVRVDRAEHRVQQQALDALERLRAWPAAERPTPCPGRAWRGRGRRARARLAEQEQRRVGPAEQHRLALRQRQLREGRAERERRRDRGHAAQRQRARPPRQQLK